jgi:hypothetical protein
VIDGKTMGKQWEAITKSELARIEDLLSVSNALVTIIHLGHPSLCYRHDGDGVCEDFERTTSIKDCGFYTPDGFEDQWTHNATANPAYQEEECPESVVIGPPGRELVRHYNSRYC